MTRDKIFVAVLAVIWPALLFCQKHDYVWEFGTAELIHPNFGGTTFDFNTNPISIYRTPRLVRFEFTNAAISSKNGNLLIYTNGCSIYNSNDQIITNGGFLNPGWLFELKCQQEGVGYSVSEGALFLPFPNSTQKYILIHQDGDTIRESSQLNLASLKVYYTIVKEEDGNINVSKKNVLIAKDTFITGFMSAVKHSDLERWWVLIHGKYNNEIYKILVDSSGATLHHIQQTGQVFGNPADAGGQAVFTPDGKKVIYYNPTNDIHIWEFNRTTGLLSNLRHIEIQDSAFIGGVAVSSNSRFAYIISGWDLYQLDLHEENLDTSIVHIDHYDGFVGPFPTTFTRGLLGPDCRIYIIPPHGDRWMHVIHQPNRKGKACDFRQHDIKMPTVKGHGNIPNFPNYRLDTGPVCDSSLMLTAIPTIPRLAHVKIYPNPTSGRIIIESGDLSQSFTDVVVYDMMGREVLQRVWEGVSELQLDLADAPGTYFVVIREEGEVVYTETVIVS